MGGVGDEEKQTGSWSTSRDGGRETGNSYHDSRLVLFLPQGVGRGRPIFPCLGDKPKLTCKVPWGILACAFSSLGLGWDRSLPCAPNDL
jgi:hypothetical protein